MSGGTGAWNDEDVTLNQVAAAWCRAEREARGWSVSRVAREAGVSRAAYTRFEAGVSGLHLATAVRLARALGGTVDEMTGFPERRVTCARCDGEPARGFRCLACGREG